MGRQSLTSPLVPTPTTVDAATPKSYVDGLVDAHVLDATDAHVAGAISVTETGIIIPSSTGNLQTALRQVEAYVQNLEERFEQHHHDDEYFKTSGLIGRRSSAADVSTGALANGTMSGSFLAPTLPVTGDGTNYVELILTGLGAVITATTAGHYNINIYDETNAVVVGAAQGNSTTLNIDTSGSFFVRAMIVPFTGTRNYNMRITNTTGGTATILNQAAATYPTMLTARWAGKYNHS